MYRRIAISTLLVMATLLSVTAPAMGADIVAIDDNHGLATDDAAAAYEKNGSVETNVERLQMNLSVHKTAEAAGVDRLGPDVDSHYLCVDYNEDVARTVRFEIPREFWFPHPQQDDPAINRDLSMDMAPDENMNNSVITVDFDGETRACWDIRREAAGYFQLREGARELVEKETGFSIPSITGSGQQWEYVDPQQLDSQDTIPLDAPSDDLTLQYDELDGNQSDRRWIGVGDCSSAGADGEPVCTIDQTKNGSSYTLLVIQTDDPPDVRYKHSAGVLDQVRSAFDDLGGVFDRVSKRVDELRSQVFGS
jgi:hypothetical protein